MKRTACSLLLLAVVPVILPAQTPAAPKASKGPDSPLFHGIGPVHATLTTNFKELRKDKGDESPYHSATISYADASASGGTQVSPVRVRTRGLWRLKNCDFPPIRLNFANKEVKGTIWHDLDEPKLVSFCKNNDTHEQYVLQELQLYRVYQLLTPVSHKARLLRMTYADSATGKIEATRYAFITEDPSSVAEVNGGKMMKMEGATPDDLDPVQATIAYLFQYMIGNTDFSFNGLHNTELIARPDGKNWPVAYDFDFSGAVNASYATPPAIVPIKNVRERYYRGFCQTNAVVTQVIPQFLAKKDAIYKLYSDSVGVLMQPKVVASTLQYFDDFYKTISDPKSVERNIFRDCRKYP
jgi:hypothetical protein